MSTIYPAEIDTIITLPSVTDLVTPVSGLTVNRLRDAVVAVESELGVEPAGIYTTVRARLDAIEGAFQALLILAGESPVGIGGDVVGTVEGLTVVGIQNNPISTNVPSDNDVLTWNGTVWEPSALAASGIKVVADIAERDAIDSSDRTEAMLVYVLDDGTGNKSYYELGPGLTNADWIVANFVNHAQDIDTTGQITAGSVMTGPIQSTSLLSAVITCDGKVVFNGIDSSVLSGTNQGVIYYDLSENKFKVSQNGSAYADLVGGGGGGGVIVLSGTGTDNIYWDNSGTDATFGASTSKNIGLSPTAVFGDTITAAAIVGGQTNEIGQWPTNTLFRGHRSFIGGGQSNKIYGLNSALIAAEQGRIEGLALWSVGQGFKVKVERANSYVAALATSPVHAITRSQRGEWLAYSRVAGTSPMVFVDSDGDQFSFQTPVVISNTFYSMRVELFATLWPTDSTAAGHWRKVIWEVMLHVNALGNDPGNPVILNGTTPILDQGLGDPLGWTVSINADSGVFYPIVSTGGGYDALALCKISWIEISRP